MKKKSKTTPKNKIAEKLKAQGRTKKWLAKELDINTRTLDNWLQKPLSKWKKPYVEVLTRLELI